MKTSLLSRLALVCVALVASTTMSMAQKAVYTETPIIAKTGYWCLVTDEQVRDCTTVRFYNDQHEMIYEEQLTGVFLDPTKNQAAHRRISRMLGNTLQQVQRLQNKSVVSTNMISLNRHTQRLYAVR